MILDTTSKTLEIILASAKTTNDCEYTADYVDTQSGTTFAPANTIGLSNGTSAVTAVAAPAASTQRAIRAFTFYNADTVNTTVTVRLYDGTNRRRVIVMTLTPGQSLVFTPEAGWAVLPSTNGQIPGTVTNDNAAAGNVGEFIESIITNASGTTATSGTVFNLTSISLSPGDWDIWGNFGSFASGTLTTLVAGISTVSGTFPLPEFYNTLSSVSGAGTRQGIDAPMIRLSLAATTIVYLVGESVATAGGSVNVYGFIMARRRR